MLLLAFEPTPSLSSEQPPARSYPATVGGDRFVRSARFLQDRLTNRLLHRLPQRGTLLVRRNHVSGLTMAASIWVISAIGMACGAGRPVLAIFTTALPLSAAALLSWVGRRVPVAETGREFVVTYKDGRGSSRKNLAAATDLENEVARGGTNRLENGHGAAQIGVPMRFNRGKAEMDELVDVIQAIRAVQQLQTTGESNE